MKHLKEITREELNRCAKIICDSGHKLEISKALNDYLYFRFYDSEGWFSIVRVHYEPFKIENVVWPEKHKQLINYLKEQNYLVP